LLDLFSAKPNLYSLPALPTYPPLLASRTSRRTLVSIPRPWLKIKFAKFPLRKPPSTATWTQQRTAPSNSFHITRRASDLSSQQRHYTQLYRNSGLDFLSFCHYVFTIERSMLNPCDVSRQPPYGFSDRSVAW
jgi:hypothetical protein